MKLDIRTYQFPFTLKQYKQLVALSTEATPVQMATMGVKAYPVGFALWSRGTEAYPAFIYRFGIVPSLVIPTSGDAQKHYATYRRFQPDCNKTVNCRRQGLGDRLYKYVEDDIIKNGKAKSIRCNVSSLKCTPGDPDDVVGFLKHIGMKAVDVVHDMYEQYGESHDGYVFEKEIR